MASEMVALIRYSGSRLQVKTCKETARCNWVLVVTKLFDIAVIDIHAKKSVRYSPVLVVTEFIVSGTMLVDTPPDTYTKLLNHKQNNRKVLTSKVSELRKGKLHRKAGSSNYVD